MKFNTITLTLILTVLFIFISPLIPNNYIYYILIFLIILHFLAHLRKHKTDRVITGFLFIVYLLYFLIFKNVDQKVLVLRTSGVLAFLLLNLVLLIGPWTRFKPNLVKYYKERRHLGVTVLLIALLHFSFIFRGYFNYSLYQQYQSSFTFFGSTALFVFVLLGLSSWNYIQKHFSLKTWKIIHFLTLLFYLGMIYIFYSINKDLTTFEIILISLFVLYWIFVAPFSFSKLIIKEVNGWKQLHVLIYIAYFSVMYHIWQAQLKLQGLWLKILFFIIISFVILSHLYGWIKKFKEDKKITISTDNEFVQVDKIENFVEGKGRKFIVNNKEIAVFKYKDEFIAVSNVCRHQKGPIYQGKIVNDYVYCPWHYWSYSTKDGCGPPGTHDCLPYYETKIENDYVYVSKNPKEKI